MSRLMRRGRRHIPTPLNIGRAAAASVEASSPTRFLSPRQFVTTVPSQATALPTPVQSILTTTVFQTVAPTSLPSTPSTLSTSAAPVQTQIPTTTLSSSIMPLPTLPTLQVGETVAGGGSAPTTVVDVAQGSNTTVIVGVAGAAGFSVLSIALFFYVRSKTTSTSSGVNEKRKTLDLRRAAAVAGQLNRPYSSRGRMG